MSTWDKSTLDEMLFGYFEGTLSPDENSRLFQYLKQHPDSYNEFESWSQTYTMRNAPLDDYEISAKLIKPDRSNRRWYLFMIFAVVVVAVLSVPIWNRKQITSNPVIAPQVFTEQKSVDAAPTKASAIESKHVAKEYSAPTVSKLPAPEFISEQKAQVVPTALDSIIDQNVTIAEPTVVDAAPTVVAEEKRAEVLPVADPVTVIKSPQRKSAELKPAIKNVPKGARKMKVDFKGGKDILKTNENF